MMNAIEALNAYRDAIAIADYSASLRLEQTILSDIKSRYYATRNNVFVEQEEASVTLADLLIDRIDLDQSDDIELDQSDDSLKYFSVDQIDTLIATLRSAH